MKTVVALAAVLPMLAQQPEVFPGGVVNAATFKKAAPVDHWVATGSLVSIFGRNLAATAASVESFPLPRTLAGTSVTFGGIPAPLLYVSPNQINAQVPSTPSDVPEPVVVTTASGSSSPVFVRRGGSNDLGIFSLDGSGCGRGAVFNVSRGDGTFSLNGPTNSVEPGGILAVFGTGLRTQALSLLPPDGEPAPANPPASVREFERLYAGMAGRNPHFIGAAGVLFAGRAPGYAGLDQYNVLVPTTMEEGCAIPLWLAGGGTTTQTVPISVRRGGGQCVDPPEQSIAVLRWKKTVISALNPAVTEDLLIEFSAAPGKQPPSEPGPSRHNLVVFNEGPPCPGLADRALDAGTLTLEPAGAPPLQVSPQIINGRKTYAAKLPAGTIRAGRFTVRGSGGADVGPFVTSVDIPPSIELTAPAPPNALVPGSQIAPTVVLNWNGGTADTIVRATCIAKARGVDYVNEYRAPPDPSINDAGGEAVGPRSPQRADETGLRRRRPGKHCGKTLHPAGAPVR